MHPTRRPISPIDERTLPIPPVHRGSRSSIGTQNGCKRSARLHGLKKAVRLTISKMRLPFECRNDYWYVFRRRRPVQTGCSRLQLQDINRHFPRVLDLGANSCNLARALTRENPDPDPSKPVSPPLATRISELIAADSSETMLYRDQDLPFNEKLKITRQVLQDEESVPYEPESFDLVMSSLSLHWINDLPGILAQINSVLKPDCPFIGAMLGGDTLFELRSSLQLAEQERRGGISPRVSPLADVRDVGGLLQKAGFKMLTVDVDDIIVDYPDTFALMKDLQAMAENNAVLGREMGPIGRDVLMANEAIYKALHGSEDGSIPATFRIIYMIGWKEGENQPKPLARGSGEVNLKDILQEKS